MQDTQLGQLLRDWRKRRRMSQLDLALEADISQRHMSFVENGRSQPSRELVIRLADSLDLSLRNRNALLVAAGFAPANSERSFDDPSLESAREVVQRILDAHSPFPALAVDRHWHLLAANASVTALMVGIDESLLASPINVLRLSLHPGGLAPRIVNLAEWKHHLLDRLERQMEASGDEVLERLADELRAYPAPASRLPNASGAIAVPMILDSPLGRLSFLSTTTMFGTPVEVTLAEMAIETFFPADRETADRLRAL